MIAIAVEYDGVGCAWRIDTQAAAGSW